MKKKRISRIIFLFVCFLCIFVTSSICIYTGLFYKPKTNAILEIDTTDKTYYLNKKIDFYRKDLIKYLDYDCIFIPESNLYGTFSNLIDTNLEVGDLFSKGDILGKYNNEDVIAPDNGIVLFVQNNSSLFTIDYYLFNKFKVQIKCNSQDYYLNDFKHADLYADFFGTSTKLFFDSFDFSQVEISGTFLINYKCDFDGYIVNDSSLIGVFDETCFFPNAVYVDNLFKSPNDSCLCAYKDSDNNWIDFRLYCLEVIDLHYQIIDTSNLNFDLLSVGDIYEIG